LNKTKPVTAGLGRGKPKARGIAIAAVVLLIAIFAAYFVTQPGVTEITTTKTVTLYSNQTSYIGIPSSVVALRLQISSASQATFYASQTPVLLGSVSLFSLAPGASANVSSAGSGSADMNIRLVSSTATAAVVAITPLSPSLGVRTSGMVSVMNPIAFGTANVAAGSGVNSVGGAAQTTLSTTVPTVTTSVQPTVSAAQQALNISNGTALGKLMVNFNNLYKSGKTCDPNTYNITYVRYYSSMPTGPASFYNASQLTPTAMVASAVQTGASGNYKVTYSTVSPSPDTSGPAVTLSVNVATASISNTTFMGVFMDLNYTTVSQIYSFQSTIPNSNHCAAYIPPP
jgi:hypothetical protein